MSESSDGIVTPSPEQPVMSGGGRGGNLNLSDEEQTHLAVFEHMRDLLRDRTRAVADRYQNGTYIVGRPGSSKTRTVVEELERLNSAWTYRNSRMTSLGLWALLEEHPEHTIVLDDIPSLVSEKPAQQILLAALGGEPGGPRTVTYTTKEVDGRKSMQFRGGIIAISNVPLRRDPLADAVQSRIPVLEHEPTDEMLAAAMRAAAIRGYKDLSPEDGVGVIDFLIGEFRECDYRLDLRAMTKAFEDYRLWRDGKARSTWQDLVRSSIKKIVGGAAAVPKTRDEKRDSDRQVALELHRLFPKDKARRDREWGDRTRKSPDTLYRHLRQLEVEGLL